jgi:hypothetical protein
MVPTFLCFAALLPVDGLAGLDGEHFDICEPGEFLRAPD